MKKGTMGEAFRGVLDALSEAFLDVAQAFRIDRLLDWIAARLRR